MNNKLIVKDQKTSSGLSLVQILIIVGIILAIALIFFLSVFLKKDNVFKRYLINNDYNCGDYTCSKKDDDELYTFTLKSGDLTYETGDYNVEITETKASFNLKNGSLKCSYKKENDKLIPENNNIDKCNDYIKNINKTDDYYKKVITETKFK